MEWKQSPNGPCQRECPCATCNPDAWWMVVCDDCGNKRCPHATDHALACTRSNDSGQPGSKFGPKESLTAAYVASRENVVSVREAHRRWAERHLKTAPAPTCQSETDPC